MLGSVYEYVGGDDMEMIDQPGWLSSKIYGDGELSGRWDPQSIIVHWGGWTEEIDSEREDDTLRGWQRYHISKGWRDIGYHYAIGESGRLYRLRGENPGGATSGRDEFGRRWNEVAISIVWIGGKKDLDGPSAAAMATLDRFARERGLPVIGHVDTGKATSCPGPDWLAHIDELNEEGDDMPRVQWEQMIDSLFKYSDEFQPSSGAEYWKSLDQDSWEWENFWRAFGRAIS